MKGGLNIKYDRLRLMEMADLDADKSQKRHLEQLNKPTEDGDI